MENKVKNRKRSNLLLILAIIAVTLIVVWVIMRFDKLDDDPAPHAGEKLIKQTLTHSHNYNLYNLLQIERNCA